MSKFSEQVVFNKSKVEKVMATPLLLEELTSTCKAHGVTEDAFRENFLDNSDLFKQIVIETARRIRKGKLVSQAYAGVVAFVANYFNTEYAVYSGVCFPPNYKDTPNAQKDREALANSSEEHPMFPTHTYIQCNGKVYEYYNGYTDGIEKVDVVEVK